MYNAGQGLNTIDGPYNRPMEPVPQPKSKVPAELINTEKSEEFLRHFFDQLTNNFGPHEVAIILQTIRDRGLDYLHGMKKELQLDVDIRVKRIAELDQLVQPILANKQ